MKHLEKNEKPFKDLTAEERAAMVEAMIDDRLVSARGGYKADAVTLLSIYRITPKPAIKPSINWDYVAPKFNWLARDKVGKSLLCYSKPVIKRGYWLGLMGVSADCFASYSPGDCPWEESLVCRPGYEGD